MKNAEWMLKNGMKFSDLKWSYVNHQNVVYYGTHKLYEESYDIPINIITKWLDMKHKAVKKALSE